MPELELLTDLLYNSGSAGLAWWRIHQSELANTTPGELLHQGYRLQALQSATTQAARMLAMEADVGSIRVGKFADIIAVSADPAVDIHALRTIDFVMKGGVVARDDRREVAAY